MEQRPFQPSPKGRPGWINRLKGWRRKSVGLKTWLALALLGALAFYFWAMVQDKSKTAPAGPRAAKVFHNNQPTPDHGLGEFFRWKWQQWTGDASTRRESDPPPYPFPLAANDPAFLRGNNGRSTLTWVGHATFLLQHHGVNLLTDPQFSGRASPFKNLGPRRVTPPGLSLEELPPIQLVLISHNHYDHLDKESLLGLMALSKKQGHPEGPLFLAPLGLKSWLAKIGITHVEERDWWQEVKAGGFTFTAVPVQHFSARSPFDRDEALWTAWHGRAGDFSFFFCGDAGYSPDFLEIERRLGPVELALLPIGSYDPRWLMAPMHLDPEEAVRAHGDLRARQSVAMHWGTFKMTDEPMDEPPKRLKAAREKAGLKADDFLAPAHGQTLERGAHGRWAPYKSPKAASPSR